MKKGTKALKTQKKLSDVFTPIARKKKYRHLFERRIDLTEKRQPQEKPLEKAVNFFSEEVRPYMPGSDDRFCRIFEMFS